MDRRRGNRKTNKLQNSKLAKNVRHQKSFLFPPDEKKELFFPKWHAKWNLKQTWRFWCPICKRMTKWVRERVKSNKAKCPTFNDRLNLCKTLNCHRQSTLFLNCNYNFNIFIYNVFVCILFVQVFWSVIVPIHWNCLRAFCFWGNFIIIHTYVESVRERERETEITTREKEKKPIEMEGKLFQSFNQFFWWQWLWFVDESRMKYI